MVFVRANFEGYSVSSHGNDMVVPDESCHCFTLDEATMLMLLDLGICTILLLLLERQRVPCLCETASQEKDITRLEVYVAVLGNLLDFLEGNCMASHSIGFEAFALGIRDVVDQEPSAGDSLLSPVSHTNSVVFGVNDLVASGAAIPSPLAIALLCTVMPKSIPLRTCLRIESPDIVPCLEGSEVSGRTSALIKAYSILNRNGVALRADLTSRSCCKPKELEIRLYLQCLHNLELAQSHADKEIC